MEEYTTLTLPRGVPRQGDGAGFQPLPQLLAQNRSIHQARPIRLEAGLTNLYAYVHDVNDWVDPWGPVEVLHFPDFDSARRAAFDIASGGDPNVQFTPTKVDPITGTEIEFKELMGLRLPTILLTLIWILLRGMINRILEFKLKEGVLMVEVRGLILPMMVTPTLIDLPRRVRV